MLVVDDDAVVRTMICRALEEEGFRAVSAGDGRLALERARRHQPALVVLDVTLPLLGSGAVAAELRALLGNRLPILVFNLTTYGNIMRISMGEPVGTLIH